MKENINVLYNQALERLSSWLHENELDRRKWANEKWAHPEGRWFKLSRIFIPALSVLSIVCVIIYCLIRDMQLMMSQLADNVMSLSYDADVKYVELYIGFMAVACVALIIGNILLFYKKYKLGAYITLVSSIVIIFHILTQIGITMPDNDNVLTYPILCIICISICAVLAVFCGLIIYILAHDKREDKRMIDNTLNKISKGQSNMLSLEDYCDLIDKYIEDQRRKALKKGK